MKRYELGAIIFKVFSVYYVLKVLGLYSVQISYVLFSPDIQPHYLALFVSQGIFSILIALVLWMNAKRLGKLIMGSDAYKEVTIQAPDYLMACVFVAFGCMILSYILSDLSELLSLPFYDEQTQRTRMSYVHLTPKIVKVVLYSVVSLFFILGANAIQRIIIKLRQRT